MFIIEVERQPVMIEDLLFVANFGADKFTALSKFGSLQLQVVGLIRYEG